MTCLQHIQGGTMEHNLSIEDRLVGLLRFVRVKVEETRFAHFLLWVWLAFALIITLDRLVMPIYTKHGQEVELPAVTGLSFEEAQRLLEARGFKLVKEGEKYDSVLPPGTVVMQNPKPSARVKTGRRIYVLVSMGERTVTMPSLIGKSETNATFMLQDLGLTVAQVHYEPSAYYPEGVVTNQSIPPSTEVTVGTGVVITVSLGEAEGQVAVPSLVGKTLDEAKILIERSGLKLGKVQYQEMADLLPETVIGQSLPADEMAARGDSLDLIVSELPSRIER